MLVKGAPAYHCIYTVSATKCQMSRLPFDHDMNIAKINKFVYLIQTFELSNFPKST